VASAAAPTVWPAILLAGTFVGTLAAAVTSQVVVVPFERAPSPYIVIRVPVEGRGCEAMLFDTGSNTTVLDPSLALRGGLVGGRETAIESLSGKRRGIIGEVRGIGFEGIPQTPRIAVAAPLAGLGRIARSVHGLYGHDWLAGTDYLIDYRNKRIVMGQAGAVPRPAAGWHAPLTWASGRAAVTVTIQTNTVEPFTARLLLDSGADAVALFGRAARAVTSATDSGGTMWIDSGFGIREVQTSKITVTIGGRSRRLVAQTSSDVIDREEDGLLPTSLFHSVFVGAGERIVVFDADVTIPAAQTACRASR